MDIRVYPPFQIENILPYSLGFNILDDSSKRRYSGWLKIGETVPVHNVDIDRTLGLQIEVPDADYNSSDLALVHSPLDPSVEESIVRLKDSAGQELRLGLRKSNIRGCKTKSSPKIFSVFSPYVIVNKTDLELTYRAQSFMIIERRAAGQNALQSLRRGRNEENSASALPLMFSFSQTESIRGRVLVKASNTEWSNAISLDAVGGGACITMRPQGTQNHNGITLLSCKVSLGIGKVILKK